MATTTTQVEIPVYGFSLEESLSTVYDYTVAGTKQGLDLIDIQKVIAVELAIQSGELETPWSQEDLENDCWDGGPHFRDTYRRMVAHPEWSTTAYGWAYHKSSSMFYMLHHYRTDGL